MSDSTSTLAVTWWGHASVTVEAGGARIATDPLLEDRLFHLRRYTATPHESAYDADVVLLSHLHHDHVHVPSLKGFAAHVPLVVPQGGERYLKALGDRPFLPVTPGDELDLDGVGVMVLPATHDGRRHQWSRVNAHALGFRVTAGGRSFWFPGDTELRDDMTTVGAVDLALVPIGGWGPTLADGHMHPEAGAEAVSRVGARWAVPVHWGTFWPRGLRRLARANHHRLFVSPAGRFVAAMERASGDATPVLARPGERIVLA